MDLSREDMMQAIADGIYKAVIDIATDYGCKGNGFGPDISVLFYDAVSEGVHAPVWQVATNATAMPCREFYEYIKDGIKEAMSEVSAKTIKDLAD